MDDGERAEINRKRHRALATQVRRALITAADGIKVWLDDDPDHVANYEERVVPGDSRKLPRPEHRPPAFVPREVDDTKEFREHDRLMRETPDPNGRRDRVR